MDAVQQQLGDVRDQLGGALEFMMDDLRQKWREISGGPSVTDGIKQFVHAVDWSERWLQGLLAFHITLLLVVILFRRIPGVHGAVFVGIMPLIYCAERLNGLAGRHWQKFAKQNYFDSQGIFTSAVLSAPLLLIMFIILVNNLIATSVLLVRMKRREIAYRARQQGRQAGRQPAAAGGTDGSEPKKDK